MKKVLEFANNALENGRDRYRTEPTPLFADGINVFTGEHVVWRPSKEEKIVVSDLACQQNFFRTLTAISIITGDPQYKEAAMAAIQYHFDRLADSSGLLQWGGHRFIDLETLEASGPGNKSLVHELKNTFPYYELMDEVNSEATGRFIKAFWNAHMYDWEELNMGRHGKYGLEVGDIWNNPMVDRPVLRESTGLSFLNAGNDLIYAAGMLYQKNGDARVLNWAKHLAKQYVKARHPETGLGGYLFTQPLKQQHTDDDSVTLSFYGDRAKRQFGPELGEIALEANALLNVASTIYCETALIQLQLADQIGEEGGIFREWTKKALLSFAKYAYDAKTNEIRPMFSDGVDLTGYTLQRDGYYGKKGDVLTRKKADCKYLLSYARAYLLTQDERLWRCARYIGLGNCLGDLGMQPGRDMKVNLQTDCHDARGLFSVLDLYEATENEVYLSLAKKIGANIEKAHFHRGYFTKGPKHIYAQFDAIEPLALVLLEAAIQNKYHLVPRFLDGKGFIHGSYQFEDYFMESVKDAYLYNELTID